MSLSKVWVYAESAEGKPTSLTLELLTKARELGDTVEAFYARRRRRGASRRCSVRTARRRCTRPLSGMARCRDLRSRPRWPSRSPRSLPTS